MSCFTFLDRNGCCSAAAIADYIDKKKEVMIIVIVATMVKKMRMIREKKMVMGRVSYKHIHRGQYSHKYGKKVMMTDKQ